MLLLFSIQGWLPDVVSNALLKCNVYIVYEFYNSITAGDAGESFAGTALHSEWFYGDKGTLLYVFVTLVRSSRRPLDMS